MAEYEFRCEECGKIITEKHRMGSAPSVIHEPHRPHYMQYDRDICAGKYIRIYTPFNLRVVKRRVEE